ncbi:MAG: hypothetical protein M3O46_19900 [Myxococcota bacterium]|nr:hypothetical protein [Myxococcota bacterium]
MKRRAWTLFLWVLGSCPAASTPVLVAACVTGRPAAADLASYAAEQQGCVSAHDTRADIDACRTAARSRWCAQWKDEVNCPARGGNQP